MEHEYPKYKYHLTKAAVVVKDADAETALGIGWGNTPACFDQYRRPRPARRDSPDCLRWVDEWPVLNPARDHRSRIKSQLLKAEAVFSRSPDDPATIEDCMQRAFAGVAEVLWDARILSEQLLENEIPHFIWDSAVAGGWWRYATETCSDISAVQIGHYWVWWDDGRNWPELFHGVRAEWLARLLDAQSQDEQTTAPHRQPAQGPALDTDRIKKWIREEGYDNRELADKLGVSARVVSSMCNNGKWHGRRAVAKLANLMQLDPMDLYLPLN